MMHATLVNNDDRITYSCSARGLTAKGYAPILGLCRMLVEAGYDPTEPMEVYRGATLSLHVRSIGEAAKLKIDERGPRFGIRDAAFLTSKAAGALK